jgi:anti-sigma factor RsiW
MRNTYLEHPAEEILERFLLHNSGEEELDTVETHILSCESCVTRLETLETQIAATKLALQNIHQQEVAKAVAKQQAPSRKWFTLPRLSMTGAVAALALGIGIAPQFTRHNAPVAQVSLLSYRGLTPNVPRDHQLRVHLNAKHLNENNVTVQLVNDHGSQLWKTTAAVKQDEIEVNVPQISEAGTRFFRIYAPSTNGEGELLREFAFNVR